MAWPKIHWRSQPFQRNGGNVIGVHELLEAVKQHGNGNEVASDCCQDALAALAPRLGEAGGQRQGAAAEGELPQHQRQTKPVPHIVCPAWGVHQHYEKEKRQGQQTRRERRLDLRHQAEGGCDKARAYEVRPKQMPRHPPRHDRRDGLGQGEVLSAESREWRCVEKRPEQDQLVPSSRLLPIAAKKDRDQPDGENQSKSKI